MGGYGAAGTDAAAAEADEEADATDVPAVVPRCCCCCCKELLFEVPALPVGPSLDLGFGCCDMMLLL
jgi:hypothetical protein